MYYIYVMHLYCKKTERNLNTVATVDNLFSTVYSLEQLLKANYCSANIV